MEADTCSAVSKGERHVSDEIQSDMIDVSGISLRDLETAPESSIVLALKEVLASGGAGTFVAGFSARVD